MLKSVSVGLGLMAVCALATAVEAKDPISVTIDRAMVMRLPAPADTVIIGNPGIADATIHDRMTLILTGKIVGMTNLVILDSKGNPIADEVLSVKKMHEGLVSVQRGANRSSYSCTPDCNTMFEVGDAPSSFSQAAGQIGQRNALAQPGNSGQQ